MNVSRYSKVLPFPNPFFLSFLSFLSILLSVPIKMSSSNILVLDNDETTGHYTNTMNYMFHALRNITDYTKTDQEMLDIIAQHGHRCGVFRPGIQAFLQDAYKRKQAGAIQAVVMYTNAPLRNGVVWNSRTWGPLTWQEFLSKVLGTLAGSTDFFDVVICRKPEDALHPYPLKSFQRIVAHLPVDLRENTRMMFFDDRTDDILGKSEHHTCVKVAPYHVRLPIKEIYTAIKDIFDGNTVSSSLQDFCNGIKADWFAHEPHKFAPAIASDLVENGCFNGVTLEEFFPYPPPKEPEPENEIVDTHYTTVVVPKILLACARRLWNEHRATTTVRIHKRNRRARIQYNYNPRKQQICSMKYKRKT